MSNTKDRILNSAEVLFAEHGFNETSLRIITSVADVNLAAVNYHFGSKKILIQAVIDRYFITFTEYLEKEFAQYENQEKVLTTQALLESLVNLVSILKSLKSGLVFPTLLLIDSSLPIKFFKSSKPFISFSKSSILITFSHFVSD